MELIQHIGDRIRTLRNSYGGGAGISQEGLAKAVDTTANTISRWETGTYRPDVEDLEKLARFFGVSILTFFPEESNSVEPRVMGLLRAARDLPEKDIEELERYAEFRRARSKLTAGSGRKKVGRPKGK